MRPDAVRNHEMRLFGSDESRFNRIEPLQELACKHQPPLARSIGYGSARGRQFFTRPTAKIAFIRFHVPLHETRGPLRVANSSLLRVIHRSSPVR